jgi:hypothetical protein
MLPTKQASSEDFNKGENVTHFFFKKVKNIFFKAKNAS